MMLTAIRSTNNLQLAIITIQEYKQENTEILRKIFLQSAVNNI